MFVWILIIKKKEKPKLRLWNKKREKKYARFQPSVNGSDARHHSTPFSVAYIFVFISLIKKEKKTSKLRLWNKERAREKER